MVKISSIVCTLWQITALVGVHIAIFVIQSLVAARGVFSRWITRKVRDTSRKNYSLKDSESELDQREEDEWVEVQHIKETNDVFQWGIKYLFLGLNPFIKRHVEYEIPLPELTSEARVYMGNHTSFSDFFIYSGVDIPYTAVGRGDLFKIPIAGTIFRRNGMLPIHFKRLPGGKWTTDKRKTQEMLDTAQKYLRNDFSLVLFPEGMVNQNKDLQAFKPGFFRVAKKAGVDVVPMAAWGSQKAWPMKGAYPGIWFAPADVYMKIGRPLPQFTEAEEEAITHAKTAPEILNLICEKFCSHTPVSEMALVESIDNSKMISEIVARLLEQEGERNDDLLEKLFMAVVREKILCLRGEMQEKASAKANK